jgi:formyltetrahydrofolate deformylase
MTAAFILTLSCPNQPGIVARVTTELFRFQGNILEAHQYDDVASGRFFTRIVFDVQDASTIDALRAAFAPIADHFAMTWSMRPKTERRKVLLLASKFDHCLMDLLYRWRIGEIAMDVVGIVSNHPRTVYGDLGDVPFHHLPVTRETKAEQEGRIKAVVEQTGAELIVLARYMQVLSDDVCTKMSGRIINIHHSFLPSFKGANPYKQAYERGVKLIGATAHYVTEDLDEGPIIEQDVARITHAQSASDYVSIGRDVESQVLARAVHAHIHHRVFMNGNKTIVFPASPGSYASERMG